MNSDLLNILRCPENHSALTFAPDDLLQRLNHAVEQKVLKNRAGREVETKLSGALVRAGGDLAYPVQDDIPILLQDEAIELAQVANH